MPTRNLIIAHCAECASEVAGQVGAERFTYVYSTQNLRGVRPGEHVDETIYVQDNPPSYKPNWANLIAEARLMQQHEGFQIERVST